jgi:hypothetical protein
VPQKTRRPEMVVRGIASDYVRSGADFPSGWAEFYFRWSAGVNHQSSGRLDAWRGVRLISRGMYKAGAKLRRSGLAQAVRAKEKSVQSQDLTSCSAARLRRSEAEG